MAVWIPRALRSLPELPTRSSYTYEKYRSSGGKLQGIISATDGTLTWDTSTTQARQRARAQPATLTQTTLGTSSSYANYTFTFSPPAKTPGNADFQVWHILR